MSREIENKLFSSPLNTHYSLLITFIYVKFLSISFPAGDLIIFAIYIGSENIF